MTHTTSGEESSEGYCGDTPSPNPRPNDSWNGIENGSLIDRDATNFNSPGPSEGGTSVDSGFGKSKSPNPNQNVSIKIKILNMANRVPRNSHCEHYNFRL